MIAEIALAVQAVSGINTAIEEVKKMGSNAQGLGLIIERYAKANDAVQDAEQKHAGKLSVAESAQIQISKKRLQTFNQQLRDLMLMGGLAQDYHEIMNRVENSRLEHERQVALIKKKRKERKKQLTLAATIVFAWVCFMGFVWFGIWFYRTAQAT